jgi:hypothetical protein
MADKSIQRFRKNDERCDTKARSKNSGSIKSASGARRHATFIKGSDPAYRGPRRRPHAGRRRLVIIDRSGDERVVSVAAMIAPMIGHGISDCRAPDTTHDRADRTADNSPGDSAPDTSGDRAAFVS